MNLTNPLVLRFFINLPAFLVALVVHEYAHGFTAYKFGDYTAKHMGRLTFNPLAHIDLFGTILLPLFLIIQHAPFVVGWAKPVPVNFYNLDNPKKNMIWVALAGPAANFITAGVIYFFLKLGILTNPLLMSFLINVFLINIVLGLFNLIPIPPLDGSRILMGILPLKLARIYAKIKPIYGMIILIFLLAILRRIF
ncbi:MAG: site-2 protease family protein [Candidatus Omnitrophota bacterium]